MKPLFCTPRLILYLLWITLAGLTVSCLAGNEQDAQEMPSPDRKAFGDYWYQGKAELSRYRLEQARYGQIHSGDAVLIFVTEDFLQDTQVKYEYGSPPEERITVLKLNFTRNFYTGIYPYSIMSSIFTPVNVPDRSTLKVTTSTQEWCGHTYMQLNLREGRYQGRFHSYFQREADQEFSLAEALLEDAVWTRIRLNPASLPQGTIEVLPGSQYLRLRHKKAQAEKATATLRSVSNPEWSDQPLKSYRLEYQTVRRVLEITFEEAFPHAIVAWEEKTPKGFEDTGEWLTTRAVRTNTLYTDYWNKNSVADSTYRKQLGL